MFFSQFLDLPDYYTLYLAFSLPLVQPENPNTSKILDLLRMHSLHQLVGSTAQRQGHTVDVVTERPDDGIHRAIEVSDALESDHMCVITQLGVTVTHLHLCTCTE